MEPRSRSSLLLLTCQVLVLLMLACGRFAGSNAGSNGPGDRSTTPSRGAADDVRSTGTTTAAGGQDSARHGPAAQRHGSQPASSHPGPSSPSPHRAERPPATSRPGPSAAAAEQEPVRRRTNRLAREASPYLLMHAYDPVDWYPWCPEAFARARKENKLIFLSIGFSSCHWCHVMQRESFQDKAIAEFLNRHFISIKVDREERPDVDALYMTALQIFLRLIGSPQGGGWPLSMFLTPDAEPFLGGTYLPPRTRGGQPGFEEMIRRVQQLWETQPDQVRTQAGDLVEAVKERFTQRESTDPEPDDRQLVDQVVERLADQYDPEYGGFGYSEVNPRMPKFPQPSVLAFLLDRARENGDTQSREMLVTTLDNMARGGIHDQVGGGFHRYSTDRFWRVPHFEKMLYDNGQLASIYAQAYTLTSRGDFRRVVQRLVDFVLRDMTGPDGAFYASLDADLRGQEGRFYVWSADELKTALAPEQYALVTDVLEAGGAPNFDGHYVLQFHEPLAQVAARRGITVAELLRQVDTVMDKLLAVRDRRPRPRPDTKVVTAWNALMIRGLTDAGKALGNPRYLATASRAADFLLDHLQMPDGRLRRSYCDNQACGDACLNDYAFLVDALIGLARATGDLKWTNAAEKLTDKQNALFWDDRLGGYYFTATGQQKLIVRGNRRVDGALPAANSVTVDNLLRLATASSRPDYVPRARKTLAAALPSLRRDPASMPRLAVALTDYLNNYSRTGQGDARPSGADGGQAEQTGADHSATTDGTNSVAPISGRQSP